MVQGDEALSLRAATDVMDNLRWWRDSSRNVPESLQVEQQRGRPGLGLVQRVPFGLPIFNAVPAGGIAVRSFAPTVVQPDIPETGDNADAQ